MSREAMKPMRALLLEKTATGTLCHPEKKGIRCVACGHRCFIPEGMDGICRVRSNIKGELKVPFNYVAGLAVDPVEKKPFFHVLPGATALSFGMLGCDLKCAYCQNWITSQTLRDPNSTTQTQNVTPEQICKHAKETGSKILTSTYNEPLITAEWAVEIFKEGKKHNFLTSFVSNGNATPEVLEFIRPHVDLYKVDLKGFDDRHYRELGGVLKNITDSIEQIHKLGFWLEIVTLVVPGFNDDPGELKALTEFVASVSPDIPWHCTAFHPDYKMSDKTGTSLDTLIKAAETGKASGLNYVYLGNLTGMAPEWENTYCPDCQTLLIERQGYRVIENNIKGANCPQCSKTIPGVWQLPGGEAAIDK